MRVPADAKGIKKAAQILREGGLVAFPTETVYGLGAHALDEAAVAKIFAAKGRPAINPLIVHVLDRSWLENLIAHSLPASTTKALDALSIFWPGPLSIVLPKNAKVPSLVTAGCETVAVRIPSHPVARALLQECGLPIAAPSANPSTYVSPTRAEHVEQALGDKIDLILDGGSCPIGVESTVISLISGAPQVLRPGAVTLEQLSEVLGYPVDVLRRQSITNDTQALASPGLMREHYSPQTPLVFRDSLPAFGNLPKRVGHIRFSQASPLPTEFDSCHTSTLSTSGNYQEVCHKLFETLWDFDQKGLDLIVIDSCPEEHLGLAIMDRLNRATAVSRFK